MPGNGSEEDSRYEKQYFKGSIGEKNLAHIWDNWKVTGVGATAFFLKTLMHKYGSTVPNRNRVQIQQRRKDWTSQSADVITSKSSLWYQC